MLCRMCQNVRDGARRFLRIKRVSSPRNIPRRSGLVSRQEWLNLSGELPLLQDAGRADSPLQSPFSVKNTECSFIDSCLVSSVIAVLVYKRVQNVRLNKELAVRLGGLLNICLEGFGGI